MTAVSKAKNRLRVVGVVVSCVVVSGMVSGSGAVGVTNDADDVGVGGSFGVGLGGTGDVDAASGAFRVAIPVVDTSSMAGAGRDVGLVYESGSADANERYGLGAWAWDVPFITNQDGDVRVSTGTGGVFTADSTTPSGLDRYTLENLVFSQTEGALPAREGVPESVSYAYTLTALGGTTEYFSTLGDLLARTDLFGNRTDLTWDANHHLLSVVNGDGLATRVDWSDTHVTITAPTRTDSITPHTTFDLETAGLTSVTDPAGDTTAFSYTPTGLLETITTSTNAHTHVSYQTIPGNTPAVDTVTVTDQTSGETLAHRTWKSLGEHTYNGFPLYPSQAELWRSGDGAYRYETELSDGPSSVRANYNSLGLLLSREIWTTTTAGTSLTQQQALTYPGTETGRVPDKDHLPAHYQLPVATTVTFHDGARTRTLTEETRYDTHGRPTWHLDTDGVTTETLYDPQAPHGLALPAGVVLEQTRTASDGLVEKTTNTPSADHRTIAATLTERGPTPGDLYPQTQTETTTESDGFVSASQTQTLASQGSSHTRSLHTREVNSDTGLAIFTTTHPAGEPEQTTTSTTIDIASGLTLETRDALDRVASIRYDAAGRPIEETSFDGTLTRTEYTPTSTRTLSANGIATTAQHDPVGRVTTITDNITTIDGAVAARDGVERVIESRTYQGAVTTVTDALGNTTTTRDDPLGRPVAVTSALGTTLHTRHDDIENTTRIGLTATANEPLDNARRVTTTRKDNAGHEIATHEARHGEAAPTDNETRYDGFGRVAARAQNDLSTTLTRNINGAPENTVMTPTRLDDFPGDALAANREFDPHGVPVKKTLMTETETRDGTTRVLDILGRVTSLTDQAGNTTTYRYTPDGLIAHAFNTATNVTTTFDYDPLTRALRSQALTQPSGETIQTGYDYHPVTGLLAAVYNPADRGDTAVTYQYDILGNLTHTRYPDGKELHHTYNEHSQETSRTDTIGNTTTYQWNRLGFMTDATQHTAAGVLLAHVSYGYDTYGRVDTITRNNGLATRYTYTATDDIKTETTTNGPTLVFAGDYTYDTHGNLTTNTTTKQDPNETLETTTTRYQYDAYNRLTHSSVSLSDISEPVETNTYQLGVAGNITKETHTKNGVATTREYETNPLGQTTAITTNGDRHEQRYDPAGNLLTAADGTRYTYNVANQQTSATHPDGTTTNSTYWTSGAHKTDTTNTSENTLTNTTTLYWDGDILTNEHTRAPSESDSVSSFLFGATRNAITTQTDNASETTVEYYVSDRHGNTVATTGAHGGITTSYRYSDYGIPETTHYALTPTTNAFQYAGEYTTSQGHQYLGARTYTPKTGTFTTRDTADQFSLYTYTHGNPITRTDPTGQTPSSDVIHNGIASSIGVFAALAGIAFTLPTTSSTWAFTVGLVVAGAIDTGIVALQAIDHSMKDHDLLGGKASVALTWVSFLTGSAALFGGIRHKATLLNVKALRKTRLKAPAVLDDLDVKDAGPEAMAYDALQQRETILAGLATRARDENNALVDSTQALIKQEVRRGRVQITADGVVSSSLIARTKAFKLTKKQHRDEAEFYAARAPQHEANAKTALADRDNAIRAVAHKTEDQESDLFVVDGPESVTDAIGIIRKRAYADAKVAAATPPLARVTAVVGLAGYVGVNGYTVAEMVINDTIMTHRESAW